MYNFVTFYRILEINFNLPLQKYFNIMIIKIFIPCKDQLINIMIWLVTLFIIEVEKQP